MSNCCVCNKPATGDAKLTVSREGQRRGRPGDYTGPMHWPICDGCAAKIRRLSPTLMPAALRHMIELAKQPSSSRSTSQRTSTSKEQ